MALTYTDQFKIASDKKNFEGLVIIGVTRVANDFLAGGNNYMSGEKVFPTTVVDIDGNVTQVNQEAEQYRNKVHNVCVRICNENRDLYSALQKMISVILADTLPDLTLEQVGAGLEDFVIQNEGVFNGIVLKAIERVAGVSVKEKQAYDAI